MTFIILHFIYIYRLYYNDSYTVIALIDDYYNVESIRKSMSFFAPNEDPNISARTNLY